MEEQYLNRTQRRFLAKSQGITREQQSVAGDYAKLKSMSELLGRVKKNPRCFPRFAEARSIIQPELLESERYHALAKTLWNDYLKTSQHTPPYLEYLCLAYILCHVHEYCIKEDGRLNDQGGYDTFMLALSDYASMRIALKYPNESVGSVLAKYDSSTAELVKFYDASMKSVAYNFRESLSMAYRFANYVRTFSHSIKRELPDCESEMVELKLMSDELWQLINALQRYTIKQSVFHELTSNSDWAVLDYRQMTPESLTDITIERMSRKYDSRAVFMKLAHQDAIPQLRAEIHKENLEDDRKVTSLSTSFTFEQIFLLGNDGELYFTAYPIPLPIRPFFEQIGAEGAYEYLRLMCIGRYGDMVLPPIIIDNLPSLGSDIMTSRHLGVSSKPLRSIMQNIYLPRKTILRNTHDIQKVIDAENDELGQRTRRFLGRVGHPRTLPSGYRPHPDARKWAKEDGFYRELEDNETWCRPVESPVPVVHRQKGRKN